MENETGKIVVMELGSWLHAKLPDGRTVEIEVTGDTTSVTVTSLKDGKTYILFGQELNNGKWECVSPIRLVDLL